LPAVLKVINLANDGPLSQTISRGAKLLQPVSL
jgi:ribose 1,5-bisphosphokinase